MFVYKQQIRTQFKAILQQWVKEFQELEKQIIDNQISNYDNLKLLEIIYKIEGQNFIQLNEEDINKLLIIDQYQFNYDVKQQLLQSMDLVKQKLILLDQDVKQQEEIKYKTVDFKLNYYDIQKIYETNDVKYIQSSLISNNQQYLVYTFRDLINIYEIKKNKVDITLRQRRVPTTFQFTLDSTKLFTGDSEGNVYGYFAKNRFKTFYKQKVHKKQISHIIVFEQFLITASRDTTIIKTNFINKNMIFKLVGHSDQVISIDYDIQKDIMISTANDESLKIWDCFNQSILIEHNLEEYNYHSLIQLINNQQDILRCDFSGFQKFEIDYQNKRLVETYSYQYENGILSFQLFNNDQNLLLIYLKFCKILNKEGESIKKIYHNLNLDSNQLIIYNIIESFLYQNVTQLRLIEIHQTIQIILFYKIVNYYIINKFINYICCKLNRIRNEILKYIHKI